MKKQITHKEAKEKYGIVISRVEKLNKVKFYLTTRNGNVIDNLGNIRYSGKKIKLSNKNKYHKEVKQSLELLAKIAEESGQYGEAKEAELKAIDTLFTFIENRI